MPWETEKESKTNIRDISSAKRKKLEDALAEVYNRPNRENDLKIDRKDLSEPISFRTSVAALRLADEIVGQRLDPIIKTRTDLFRIALGMFFDSYKAAKKADVIGNALTPLITEYEVEKVRARLESDRRFIQTAEQVIREGDSSARAQIKKQIDARINNFKEDEEENKDRINQLLSLRRQYYSE